MSALVELDISTTTQNRNEQYKAGVGKQQCKARIIEQQQCGNQQCKVGTSNTK
jgi:hypothetical protein